MNSPRPRKILWVSRSTSDFERFCALAVGLKGKYEFSLYCTYPKTLIRNRGMLELVRSEDRRIYAFEDASSLAALGARLKAKGTLGALVGKTFRVMARLFRRPALTRLFRALAPELMFIDYVGETEGSAEFQTIRAIAKAEGVPVATTITGATVILNKPSGAEASAPFCATDYPFSAHQAEFDLKYKLHLPRYKRHFVFGDPRYSPEIIGRLHERSAELADVDGAPVVAIFGGSLTYTGISDLDHDRAILALIKAVRMRYPNAFFLYKYHPGVPQTAVRREMLQLPRVRLLDHSYNSSEVMKSAGLVFSVASAVLGEALVLGKRFAFLDFHHGSDKVIRLYDEARFPVIPVARISDFDYASIPAAAADSWFRAYFAGGSDKTPLELADESLAQIFADIRGR